MKKWVEVEGKMMDSVEFTRFIREKTAPEIEKMAQKVMRKGREDRLKLVKLQQLS